ncbi:Retrovirus-related Pol polyprotein from transposon 17.6, partial [Mucuna pruriens]
MPFGLCYAPSTFRRCMLSIFSDLLEDCIEVFMDDFMAYANTLDACLENLARVLKRCIETNLVLNFEKCHFMVTKGILLSHLVSSRWIEVDKAKIYIITSFPNPALVQENFSKTTLSLSKLLQKDMEPKLTFMTILQAPNWELPFELMCNASNSILGVVLGQRDGVGQLAHVITYASRTMDLA